MIDLSKIKDTLLRHGYSKEAATLVASELIQIAPPLENHVKEWMEGRTPDFESLDYSISGLMVSRQMTYPAALLTMDWLLKEPTKAIESLKKGIK